MTLTTDQKLAQAEAFQAEMIAREKALQEEIAKLQAQQEKNRQEIKTLQQRQSVVAAGVKALTALDSDDLFNEIVAIATASRISQTTQAKAPQPQEKKEEKSTNQLAPEKKPEISSYLLEKTKEALIPYCLGISETLENAMLLEDYDNPDIGSPGCIHWENNQLIPSQNLLNWCLNQHHEWEEIKVKIEEAIASKTNSKPAPVPETEVFEHPYKPLTDEVFILISEENPLIGKFKQKTDLPRHYEVLCHNSEVILQVTTTSGAKLRSNWGKFPTKYRTATRLILKHYTENPLLMKKLKEMYPSDAKQYNEVANDDSVK